MKENSSPSSEKSGTGGTVKSVGSVTAKTIVYIIVYVLVSAIIKYIFEGILPMFHINVVSYESYVQILLAFVFGYLIVSSIAQIFYYSLLPKYGRPTAAAVRNIVRIVRIGASAAAIAGAVAGVALGGFLGIVIGFASQQVLGQAVAGHFLLIVRPFKINDNVNIAGEDGVVDDVSSLFITVIKPDDTKVLIPNNAIIGNKNKIYLKPVAQQQQQQKAKTTSLFRIIEINKFFMLFYLVMNYLIIWNFNRMNII